MKAVLYSIKNTITGKVYIGSSVRFSTRIKRHFASLAAGTHHNVSMQQDCDKFGTESFEYEIIELFNCDREHLYNIEQCKIDELRNEGFELYNIASAVFGDTATHHPDRKAICSKISKGLITNYKNMSEDERQTKFGNSGESNPNYNPNIIHNCVMCGEHLSNSTIARRGTNCSDCRERHGSKNPFYGRKHSDATKLKLSSSRKGIKPTNSFCIFAEEMHFSSQADCAKYFGVSAGTVTYRLRNGYKDWKREMPNDHRKGNEPSRVASSDAKSGESL